MSLRVDLSGDSSGFGKMLAEARYQTKQFSNSIERETHESWSNIGRNFGAAFAGMFTLEGIKSGVEWFVESGKQIKETAEQVDMSTDSWQKWSQAVEDAGLSTEGLSRAIETLRQKRTDALTDPKARGELTRLGFSDADITGSMGMSEFLERALGNANKGDLQRSYLSNVIGERGLKYASALGKLPGENAAFSNEDIKEADESAGVFKKLSRVVSEAGLAIFKTFSSGEAAVALKNLFMPWKSGAKVRDELAKADAQAEADWNYQPVTAVRDGSPIGPNNSAQKDKQNGVTSKAGGQSAIDPMDAKLAAQQEEMALHDQEEKQRMLDSERGLMTIGQRRSSIMEEMTGLQGQINSRNSKMKGEGFLTDAQKDELAGVTGKARTFAVNALREKFKGETDDMQLRYNKDKGDLREKPLDQKVTADAKLGIYHASDAHVNMDMIKMKHVDSPEAKAAKEANALLKEIAKNTSQEAHKANDNHTHTLNKLHDAHMP